MSNYDAKVNRDRCAAGAAGIRYCSRIRSARDKIAKLESTVENWTDTSNQNQRNADYYRELLVKCGEFIGEPAYISDDGTKNDDVLCAKIPELVESLTKELEITKEQYEDTCAEALGYEKELAEAQAQYESANNERCRWQDRHNKIEQENDTLRQAVRAFVDVPYKNGHIELETYDKMIEAINKVTILEKIN